jgi:ketosteroid isomerase-like protein
VNRAPVGGLAEGGDHLLRKRRSADWLLSKIVRPRVGRLTSIISADLISITMIPFSRLLLGFLLLVLSNSVRAADSKETQEIRRIGRAFDQAYIDRKVAFIDATLTEDCLGIWADGSTSSRGEMLDSVKTGTYKLFSITYKEEKIRVYDTAAVSTVLATVDEEDQGKRQTTTGWATTVWIKKDGKWKIASVHISNKPKAE